MSLFFTKFVKLDPDPHGSAFILPPGSGSAFRKTAGSGSAKNECGSAALILTHFPVPFHRGMWEVAFRFVRRMGEGGGRALSSFFSSRPPARARLCQHLVE